MIETSDPNDSEPLQAFKKKLKNLKQLLQLMLHQVERIHDEPLKELKAAIDKNPLDADALKKPVNTVVEMINTWMQLHPFLHDWMLVILISFTEAYLEDVLTLLVAHKPEWMRLERKKILSCAADLALGARDLSCPSEKQWQEPVENMQRRWVKNFLSEEPADWIKAMTKLGANYPDDLTEKMTALWKKRHDIVHSSKSELMDAAGVAYKRSKDTFLNAGGVIDAFIDPTDIFLMGFLKGTTTHP